MIAATRGSCALDPLLTPEQIFRDYAARIYNQARRLLGSDADADDVTQEVFVQVLRKLPSFQGKSAFPTWLYRVTLNAALSYRRKRAARRERYVPDMRQEFLEDASHHAPARRWLAEPEELALERETGRLIEEAIGRLPKMYREVYRFAEIEELSNTTIAGMLRLSVPAVKSRLHRARLLMRKALAPYVEEQAAGSPVET
jgi:RNA polymerase sigma-70 factor (ECF subfamily)